MNGVPNVVVMPLATRVPLNPPAIVNVSRIFQLSLTKYWFVTVVRSVRKSLRNGLVRKSVTSGRLVRLAA